MLGLCRVVAKEGAACNVRASVVCPGFVRTPLVDQQIPEQAKELGINEDNVVKHLMLKDTVDGEFTTTREPRWLRRPSRTRRPGCSRTAQRARPATTCGKPVCAGLA
jgi:NAD(P)-dependent dehydrogenase (short-subunit alcohol dehydrogenase family)